MPTMSDAMRLKYKRTEVWLPAADVKAIEKLKARYGDLMSTTGSTITTTAVIRRAIRLLRDQTRSHCLLTPGSRLTEIAAMAEVINRQ